MTKKDFLNTLVGELSALSLEELKQIKGYYEEMIDDRVEEGMTEAEAVAQVGSPEQLAEEILRENGLSRQEKPPAAASDDPFSFRGELETLTVDVSDADVTARVDVLPPGVSAQLRLEGVSTEECRWDLTGGRLSVIQRTPARKALFRFRPRRMEILLAAPELQWLDHRGDSGDVRLVGLRLDRAQINCASGDALLEDVTCAGDLKVASTSGDSELLRTQIGGQLTVQSGSGDLKLARISAQAARLNASSGDIEVSDAAIRGDFAAQTASGDQEFAQVSAGAIEAVSQSGDVELESVSVETRLCLQTASGDLKVSRASADAFAARTNSGELQILNCAFSEMGLTSASGDVTLRETEVRGDLTANTVSGDVRLTAVRAGGCRLSSKSGDVRGSLRGADYVFQTQTVSGSAHVPSARGDRPVEVRTVSGSVHIECVEG